MEIRNAETPIETAERIIANCFGEKVRLRSGEIYQSRKSLVMRYYVAGGTVVLPLSVPTSFIVKHTLVNPEISYQAEFNLLADWAGCLFLQTLPGPYPWAPRCYGGDLDRRILVLEDLGTGTGPNTTQLLMNTDPCAAEQGLLEHARLLGSLHAGTAGTADTYRRIRAALGAEPKEDALFTEPWSNARRRSLQSGEIDRVVCRYSEALELLGIAPCRRLRDEIAEVASSVESDPGPYLAYCRGDQNMAGDYLRCGNHLRLFDFDSGGFRHVLIEGMPGRMTWGCMLRIPATVVARMDEEYRRVWAACHPEAAAVEEFSRAMASAGAFFI